MRSSKVLRSLTVVASATLVFGAFVAGPADAAKKKKPKAACPAYVPGENGAGEPVNVVTDAHTADAPLAKTVTVGPGVGSGRNPGGLGAEVSHVYVPIQVDTASAAGALYINASWPVVVEDYDLYLDAPDGTEVANSAGYGPVDDGTTEDSTHDFGSETIISVDTADCGGYTLDVVGATTPGGDVELTFWLGE